ncbi:MAG: hypothetical protein JNM81_08495 [Rhodospirillaceae bacterium]|nr:hypothetical protein [Rhodospirillaceae bacterium]
MTAAADQKALNDQIAFCMNAIAADAPQPFPYLFLAMVRFDEASYYAARMLCEQAITRRPAYAEAWLLLGRIAETQNDAIWAKIAYRKAVTFAPLFDDALARLRALAGDAEAERLAQTSWPQPSDVVPEPDWLLDECNDEETLRDLIADEGFSAKRLIKLAAILESENRFVEAHCFARYVLTVDAKNAGALLVLANLARQAGDHERALKLILEALDAMPTHPVAAGTAMAAVLNACAWDRYAFVLERATCAAAQFPGTAEPLQALLYLSDPKLQAGVAHGSGARLIGQSPIHQRPAASVSAQPQKITIGYMSADFHPHPIGRLMASLIPHHDRSRFTLRAYATRPTPDSDVRTAIQTHVDSFDDLYGLNALAAAQKIAGDHVDILVDLTGYTLHNRVDVLAQQPAPVQVAYAGYLGTMSVPFMQYQILDTTVAADIDALAFSEKIVRLPFSMLAGDRHQFIGAAAPVSRAAAGLPATGTVFCNFSLPNRLNPGIFDVWIRILNRVPGSVLWLIQTGDERRNRIRAHAFTNGLDPSRIIFSDRLSYDDYLQRFVCADLFLDTLPQNAGAVANDALWMGCPILTCSGQTVQSRVGAGMLLAAGIPELAVNTLQAYEDTAVRLGQDSSALASLRTTLIQGRDTNAMFDAARMTRALEKAYAAIWQRYVQGQPPAHIDV